MGCGFKVGVVAPNLRELRVHRVISLAISWFWKLQWSFSIFPHTEVSPPLNFSITLAGDDGVHVRWTPAPSADSTLQYTIYYSNAGQVSVPALDYQHTLRNLVFGETYNFYMAAHTDFESRIGPLEITIGKDLPPSFTPPSLLPPPSLPPTNNILFIPGIPDVPESLRAVPTLTSIQLHWSPPSEYHGPITGYQVSYSCAGITTVSNVSTGISWTLTGLRPETTCVMKVRAYTGAGAGSYSNTLTVTTTPPRKCVLWVQQSIGTVFGSIKGVGPLHLCTLTTGC
jgi:hypothetical protein